jgi:hypothetical protein
MLTVLPTAPTTTTAPAAALDDHGSATLAVAPSGAHYVGAVARTDFYLALVVDDQNHILAYVCDGETPAEWFTGAVTLDGLLEVRSAAGMHLLAEVRADGAPGIGTIEGAEHRVNLVVAA